MNFEDRVRAKRDEMAAEVARHNVPVSAPAEIQGMTERFLELIERLKGEPSFVRVFGQPCEVDTVDLKIGGTPIGSDFVRQIMFLSQNADRILGRDVGMDMEFRIVAMHADPNRLIGVHSTNEIDGSKDQLFPFGDIEAALDYLEDQVADFCADVLEHVEPTPPPGS